MKSIFLLAAAAATLLSPAFAFAQGKSASAAAKDEIWALEQSIYAGRAKGDLTNYVNNTSPDYLSWPPSSAAPMRIDVLKDKAATPKKDGKEKLAMEFMDFSLHGDTAVIYYRTHRTQLVDGTPVDERFQVTHTWVRDNGKWMVFAGMARKAPGSN